MVERSTCWSMFGVSIAAAAIVLVRAVIRVSGGWLDCERVGEGRRKKEKAENLELSEAGVKIAGQRRWDVKRQQAEKLAVAARERESLDCFSFCLRSVIWGKDLVRNIDPSFTV